MNNFQIGDMISLDPEGEDRIPEFALVIECIKSDYRLKMKLLFSDDGKISTWEVLPGDILFHRRGQNNGK